MTSWAEKYRPKTLDDVVGNPTAIAELRKWAAAWDRGRPDKRAVVLQGDPGIGKTSAALALANEMGWSVVKMNASESRNAEAIHKVATRGAVLQTFTDTGEFVRADEGGRKLIVLDEADNVFGREDRGGVAAIVPAVEEILRSGDARRARDAARELGESPEDLILWVDQNLAHEFSRPDDLARGYDALSRSDIFLGRTRRRQKYGLWSYATELMSSGVAVARKGRTRDAARHQDRKSTR